jgi:hypothetical protein
MAGSDWNRFLDRLVAEELTVAEHRLALALMRLLLGWRRRSHKLGVRLLRDTARLHGRTFEKARDGLVEKGLIRFNAGRSGRGHAGLYEVLVDPLESSAQERTFTGGETPARERTFAPDVNVRSQSTKTSALERPLKGSSKEKHPASPALHRRAFDAYLNAGGTLILDRERGSLARAVSTLQRKGVADVVILAACRDLGRRGEFPGLLIQRAQEIAAGGGPCQWERLTRSALTITQLMECSCRACAEWADTKRELIPERAS